MPNSHIRERALGIVFVGVGVAPTAGGRGQCGHDGVERIFLGRERATQFRGAQTDTVAIGEHIDLAQAIAENVDGAFRRESSGAHHLNQAGFADAVGSEQHPFLALVDFQIDLGENHASTATKFHVSEFQCDVLLRHSSSPIVVRLVDMETPSASIMLSAEGVPRIVYVVNWLFGGFALLGKHVFIDLDGLVGDRLQLKWSRARS